MSVKIKSNVRKIISDTDVKVNVAIRYALEDIDDMASPNTPKDKGNLRRDTLKQVLGKRGTIMWKKEYAIYQEEKQFGRYTTPGTGPHFARNAVKKAIDKSAEYFKRAGL